MITKASLEHLKDVVARNCADCQKDGCAECDVKDARMTVDMIIASGSHVEVQP